MSRNLTHFEQATEPDSPSTDENIALGVVDAQAISSAAIEHENEIVALEKNRDTNKWTLSLGHGYAKHWQKATTNNEISKIKDVFVVSVLGNTTAGKSFVTKHLLENKDNGPQLVDESEIQSSTTGNINAYDTNVPNNSVKKLLLLDYEGEKGSSFPLMLQARRLFAERVGLTSSYAKERRKAVTEYFPKLAYVLSNVVILIGKEELISADYLNRCYEFTLSANTNITDLPYLPVLIIIENKCSLAKKFGIDDVTKEFFQIHHRETDDLEKYFSHIYCIRLPHTEQTQRVKSVKLEGEVIFNEQLAALKNVIANIVLEQQERLMTYPQWLFLLERVLDSVSHGEPVSIHSLLSTISGSTEKVEYDIALRFFWFRYFKEKMHTPKIFQECRDFAMRVLSRNIAVKLLEQENLLSERLVRDTCKVKLLEMYEILDEYKPCEAIYPGPGESESGNPVSCFQHKGSHPRHRTSEGIKDLTWWSRLFRWPSTAVWDGPFISSVNDSVDERNLEEYSKLAIECVNSFKQNQRNKYLNFTTLLEEAHITDTLRPSHTVFCDCCLQRNMLSLPEQFQFYIFLRADASFPTSFRICKPCKVELRNIAYLDDSTVPRDSARGSTQTASTEISTVDDEDCVICMAAKKDYAFIPCGHKGFCLDCANRQNETSKRCPICRETVDSILKVHDV